MLNEKEMKQRITEMTNSHGYELEAYKIDIHGPCDIYITIEVSKGEDKVRIDEMHFDPCGHQDELFEYYAKIIQHTDKTPWIKSLL